MNLRCLPTIVLFGLAIAISTACSKTEEKKEKKTTSTTAPSDPVADARAEIKEALAQLSDADRKLAEAQKVCPVGDGDLGSMGVPYRMEVQDRVVFLCCEGCKGEVEKDPAKYLAKVDEQLKKSSESAAPASP